MSQYTRQTPLVVPGMPGLVEQNKQLPEPEAGMPLGQFSQRLDDRSVIRPLVLVTLHRPAQPNDLAGPPLARLVGRDRVVGQFATRAGR